MGKVIILRHGEIFLKGNNKASFESALIGNVKRALSAIPCSVVRSRNRTIVKDFAPENADRILSVTKKVFGICSVSLCERVLTSKENIFAAALNLTPESGTFRITVNRADKKFKTPSTEFSAEVGAAVYAKNPTLKVDLFNAQTEIYIDIREEGDTYVFADKEKGAGGLPYGTGGKGVILMSGGIDSPVAAYMVAKRGLKLVAVHYESAPHTSAQALQKVKDLITALAPYAPAIKLITVPFAPVQYAIHRACPESFMIAMMRRFMMKIATVIAKNENATALVTGENLGQVASQTIESITCSNAATHLPVLRPLIGFDKEEIITIAQKIETFDISIRPYEDCCTVFLPDRPVIKPKLADIEKYEALMDCTGLIETAVKNVTIYEK
ncbi:MAG: tRNA 4-thiouridine(8) synthase ThiI [Christensenellaceae bacterium]|jgi:thiamine biosynthesis protein ThiI|nr:tRNA 4-thiouridine(8) synthase ThiI [Christensenellaceae bacterium]